MLFPARQNKRRTPIRQNLLHVFDDQIVSQLVGDKRAVNIVDRGLVL
jgi:hypothetical protein